MADADSALISYVQRAINSGATRIVIPMSLISSASENAISSARQLCAINGVELVIGPG